MAEDVRVARLHDRQDLRIETLPAVAPGPGEVVVALKAGGICGSDLHYYHDGGFGAVRLREPMILGHEVAGEIAALGSGISGLAVGDRVAVNPSHPCNRCEYCLKGAQQHCLDMRFFGSAARFPHAQGAFRSAITVPAGQCEPIGSASFAEGACAEPLAVCLHAATRAGDLKGRRVLVTGAGPIGALCTAVARFGGAADIIVTDLEDAPLAVAEAMGATRVVNVARDPSALSDLQAGKGQVDVAFECSAAGPAIRSLFPVLRPGGLIVQVGIGSAAEIPLSLLVQKEIDWRGAQRFHAEYPLAARLIASGRIDVTPMLTGSFPLTAAAEALDTAGDRSRSVKVVLELDA